jgi:hypothetical protein
MILRCILNLTLLSGLLFTSACSSILQPEDTPDIKLFIAQTQTSITIDSILTVTPSQIQASPNVSENFAVLFTETPLPPSIPNCDNLAHLENETFPDQTSFSPGEQFEKKWTIQNVGSCTWDTSYSLVFVGGETMNANSPIQFNHTVVPNETIELKIQFSAPQEEGYYEGFWKLQNNLGEQFGLGVNADVPLWVKIYSGKKQILGESLNLGEPDWRDTFDEDRKYLYLGTAGYTNYAIQNGELIINTLRKTGDVWRVIRMFELGNIFVETMVRNGEHCSGKDGFGLVIRAPDKPNGVINSGYIVGISCDGMFRIYRLDNGKFVSINDWTASENINLGSGQSNRLGIKADGPRFSVYANGELLTEFLDNKYPFGMLGLMIRSENTEDFNVYIDEIGYWNLY